MENGAVFTNGAHTPNCEILGSKWPRQYICSTIVPATPFKILDCGTIISSDVLLYSEMFSVNSKKNYYSGSHPKAAVLPGGCVRRLLSS